MLLGIFLVSGVLLKGHQSEATDYSSSTRWWRYLFLVEVLYVSSNNISTDFLIIMSTNYSMVEVVEMVEVLSLLLWVCLSYNFNSVIIILLIDWQTKGKGRSFLSTRIILSPYLTTMCFYNTLGNIQPQSCT